MGSVKSILSVLAVGGTALYYFILSGGGGLRTAKKDIIGCRYGASDGENVLERKGESR